MTNSKVKRYVIFRGNNETINDFVVRFTSEILTMKCVFAHVGITNYQAVFEYVDLPLDKQSKK